LNWDQTFSTYQVTRLFRTVSKRQLQYWDEQGIVGVKKNGHARVYTFADVLAVGVLDNLKRRGMSTQVIKKLAFPVAKAFKARSVPWFIIAGKSIKFIPNGYLIQPVLAYMSIAEDRPILVRMEDVIERIESKIGEALQRANAAGRKPKSKAQKSPKTKNKT
jgi:DNA-binding transcriptional MerR regulator